MKPLIIVLIAALLISVTANILLYKSAQHGASAISNLASFYSFIVQTEKAGVKNIDDLKSIGLGPFTILGKGSADNTVAVKFNDMLTIDAMVVNGRIYTRDQ